MIEDNPRRDLRADEADSGSRAVDEDGTAVEALFVC